MDLGLVKKLGHMEHDYLAERFEQNRGHLRSVAYRMLGSLSEADDAVQETWLRLSRSDTSSVQNLSGWLTTVVSRVCLDMLRARASRCEEPFDDHLLRPAAPTTEASDPEQEALLADSVGLALLVVLDRLAPAERLAFVLHDMFAIPFEEVGSIVGRTPAAARQLASRARRRVQGISIPPGPDISEQRKIVDAFLAALRAGDLNGVLAVLDPQVVRRADAMAVPLEESRELRGAANVAREALARRDRAQFARSALVDGSVGIVVAPHGHLVVALRCAVKDRKIIEMEVIGERSRLRALDITVPKD
jgi:RNA polymerase sigma-70 factor (ECF subfamily)